ncbi:methyltransferase family protein [Sinorhizobium meliloti]|uniref:methyltransferase family protein n=1 Tax=Rhizobium meliloti TaxID=382 RepID=UPI0013E36F84|nr:isoprenylcysteine carboxylmethyltransferase family protein [Sinorhizobium meliloti]
MIDIVTVAIVWTYVLGFLLLTVAVARRTEASIWLFSKGSGRQTFPATLFRIAFTVGAALPLLTMLTELVGNAPWYLARADVGQAGRLFGLAAMAAGTSLALYAQNYMGQSWRIGAAEGQLGAIVDSGPFSYSRNPVFVGQVVLFAGLALVFPTLAQVFIAIAVLVAAILQVRIEERVLERDLGAPYLEYRRRVRRWF